jgi:hypothetical protein
MLHFSHLSSGPSTIGPIVAGVPTRLRLTPPCKFEYVFLVWFAILYAVKHLDQNYIYFMATVVAVMLVNSCKSKYLNIMLVKISTFI